MVRPTSSIIWKDEAVDDYDSSQLNIILRCGRLMKINLKDGSMVSDEDSLEEEFRPSGGTVN